MPAHRWRRRRSRFSSIEWPLDVVDVPASEEPRFSRKGKLLWLSVGFGFLDHRRSRGVVFWAFYRSYWYSTFRLC